MNIKEYGEIIKGWEAKYGVPSRAFSYDPTEVNACCKKCGKSRPSMARHHKGNDFFFALWFPGQYAARYIQFHKDDCDKLCEKCHSQCHKYFYKLAQEMYEDFELKKILIKYPPVTATQLAAWAAWCDMWKFRFLILYARWIKQPVRKRRKRRRSAAKREARNGTDSKRG